jgi:hypothetical protein
MPQSKRSGSPIGVRYLSKSCRRRATCLAAVFDPKETSPAARVLHAHLRQVVPLGSSRKVPF